MKNLLKKAFDKSAEALTALDAKIEEKCSQPREGASEHEILIQTVAGMAACNTLRRSVEMLNKGRKSLD